MKGPKCATENSENAKFCKSCGLDLRDIKKLVPVLSATDLQCLKCGGANSANAKFCKACGTLLPSTVLAPAPPPVPALPPVRVPPPAPMLPPVPVTPSVLVLQPEALNGVACYKCKTINNPNAKFCKSCGVPNPTVSPPSAPPSPPANRAEQKRPLIIWASITVGVLAIAGGGAYWMFIGGGQPKTATATPAPLPRAASSAPAPAAPAIASNPDAPTTAASASTAPISTTTLPAADPPKAADVAQDSGKADKPQAAASVPIVQPAIQKSAPVDTRQGPTQAERDAREAARKRQAERDQAAKQKELDKANMNKANRTLDDLLK